MSHVSQEMKNCIAECTTCHEVCLSMVQHCLERGGTHAQPAHVRTLLDCAQICATSADFMTRGSPLHAHTCGACAAVCDACASDCERMADDAEMKRCAETCRRCAASCRHMAMAMSH